MSTAITAVVPAVSSLTLTDSFDDTETAIIGGKTYTGKTTLTNTDGFFKIDTTAGDSTDAIITLDNLAKAINLGSITTPGDGTGSGTAYAAATTAGLVYATRPSDYVLKIWAKTPGAIGNQITTTETHGEGAWTSTVMASGSGAVDVAIGEILAGCQVNAEVEQLLRRFDGRPTTE